MLTWHCVTRGKTALCAIAGALLLAGCGGSSSPDNGGTTPPPGTNPTLFTRSASVTNAGGQVEDAARGIRVVVPPAAFRSTAAVTLTIKRDPISGVAINGFTNSPNTIEVGIDVEALANTGSVQVEVPAPGAFSDVGSMVMIVLPDGTEVPVSVIFDSARNTLIATLPRALLAAIDTGDGQETFQIVAANIRPTSVPASGRFLVYNPATDSFAASALPAIAGKRVAVVVHGAFENGAGLAPLGKFLASDGTQPSNLSLEVPTETGGSAKIYDTVLCFDYDWRAPMTATSAIFVQRMATLAAAQEVEIFAHGTGGLLARWAIEKQQVGTRVKRLIMMGTPNAGIPLPALQLMVRTLARANVAVAPMLTGLADMGAKTTQQENPSALSFVRRLNDGESPYRAQADYFVLAGTRTNLEISGAPVGTRLSALYARMYASDTNFAHDGLVPVPSAINSVLLSKSVRFAENTSLHSTAVNLNHLQLAGDTDLNRNITMMQAVRIWIVTGINGSVQ